MSTVVMIYIAITIGWAAFFAFVTTMSTLDGERRQARWAARMALAAPGWPISLAYGAFLLARIAYAKEK